MRQPAPPPLAELTSRLAALAGSLGLVLPAGGATRGQAFGVDVRLEIRMRQELMLRVRIPSALPTGLQLDSELEAARTRRPVGFRDIQVGAAAFDDCVHVRALNPAAAIRLLRDEQLLRRIPQLLTAHPRARLAGDELILPLPSELSTEQVLALMKETAELAVELGRAAALEASKGPRYRAESAPSPEATPEPVSSTPPTPAAMRSGAPANRLRPGAGMASEQSGRAYLHGVRRSFVWRRWAMFALRLGALPAAALAAFFSDGNEAIEVLIFMGALGAVLLSAWVWRCPACRGTLDTTDQFFLGPLRLRACPHCYITLNPRG